MPHVIIKLYPGKLEMTFITVTLYILAFLGLIASVVIALFITSVSCDSGSSITLNCYLIGGSIGLITLILYSLLPLVAAIALKKEKHWWKKPIIVYSILILFAPPIGTAIGLFLLIYIRNFSQKNLD